MEPEETATMSREQCESIDRVIGALDREFTATAGTPLAVLWNDLGDELANLRAAA